MLDDIAPPSKLGRTKPKRIEPLEKTPGPSIHELAAAEEPGFQTPDEIAAREPAGSSAPPAGPSDPLAPPSSGRLAFLKPPYSKKQKIIISCVVAGLILVGTGAGWLLTHGRQTAKPGTNNHKLAMPAAVIIYSKLSGLPVPGNSVNQRPVTAVMVENSIDARPQSGLSQAGVVYEAVAEGGVTRFMALYQDQVPTNVGPVRSARPYYVQWALGYDASYAHVGGSPDALNDITSWGVHDLNQFYNGDSYHRISSRAAPHNVYTGIDTLNQLEQSKGYGASNYTGFERKADQPYKAPTPSTKTKPAAPTDKRTPATSIDFSLSGYTYDPHYDYDATTNSYKRSEAGEAHIDANTGAQLSPKVVVALATPLSQGELDSSGAYYSNYNVLGSGQAWVFQDGTVIQATWTKNSNADALTLTTSDGKPLALNRGQTWISAVTDAGKVSYK